MVVGAFLGEGGTVAAINGARSRRVFISYSKKLEGYQIDIVHKGLLDRKVDVQQVPYDVTGGSTIAYQIKKTNSSDNILLVCLSEGSLKQDWINQALTTDVLDPLGNKISQLGIVKVDTVETPKLFASYQQKYAQRYKEFGIPLAADPDEVEQQLDAIASWVDPTLENELSSRRVRPQRVASQHGSVYYPVSGVFAVDNPDIILLTDLRRQIARGEVDQKYLYWDVQGAKRWSDIADRSTYQTAQMAQSLLGTRGSDIVSKIVEDAGASAKSGFRFINLGVGIGWKDAVILRHLLEQTNADVGYVAIDQSFSIMQVTIQRLEPLMRLYGQRLHMYYIVDDFTASTDRFNDYIKEEVSPQDSPKIIGFLGGSLGNFRETNILAHIRAMMSPQDYLLLGVEYIGGRKDDELKSIYSDEVMCEFWSGPIRDITGTDPNEFDFDFPVVSGSAYSDVENSKTIVARITHEKKGTRVQVCWMTKYEPKDLEPFLRRQRLRIIEKYVEGNHNPPWFGKYILKLSG